MRRVALTMAVAMLGGCDGTPPSPVATRPAWGGAAIDGIAPLMSPRAVQVALARNGYVQVPCPTGGVLPARPLDEDGARPCYRSPRRPLTIGLYSLDLTEGRRLAVVDFNRFRDTDGGDADRLAFSAGLARMLRARLGPPSTVVDQSPDYRSFYWTIPGGQPEQPDTIRTTVSRHMSPGITMTSMWAYGAVRADR